MIKKVSQNTTKESKKIFYEMKVSERDEGFKLKDYEPILLNKMFLKEENINKITHVGGQPNQKVFYCDEGYGLVKYKSDRFGFRNEDKNWDLLNNENKIKIMFVGDSFIHGACVHEKDVISTKLQSFDEEKLITFNLGMAGNNSLMNAYTIKTFFKKIKPRYLIIGIHPNDREEFSTDKYFSNQINNNLLEKYFDHNGTNLNLSKELVNSIKIRNFKLNDNKKIYFSNKKNFLNRILPYLKLNNLREIVIFYKEKYFFKLPNDTKLLINLVNNECNISSCTPLFIFIPASKYWNNDQNQFIFRDRLQEYLKDNNNLFLDLSKTLKFDDKNYYAIKGGHLSPSSYNIISDKIYKIISDKIYNKSIN
tara:strand:+ start:21108 stop:22202 length:1095 start_codon:yes stop_codon:yes gene_type:complete